MIFRMLLLLVTGLWWSAFGQVEEGRAIFLKGSGAPSANCTVGERYFRTDATAGQNLYLCTATNTWTQVSGGGGSSYTATGISCAEDFVAGIDTGASQHIGVCGWRAASASGSGTMNYASNEADAPGIYNLQGAGSASDDIYMVATTAQGGVPRTTFLGSAQWDITARIKIASIASRAFYVGVASSPGSISGTTDGCWVLKNSAAANFFLRCRTTSSNSDSSTFGTAADGTWVVMRVWKVGTTVYAKVGTSIDTVISTATGSADASLTWSNSTAVGYHLWYDTIADTQAAKVDYVRTAFSGLSR